MQILKLKSTIQNWIVLFLFFVFSNKGRSQVFIQNSSQNSSTFYVAENSQDASAFYMAENANMILEKRISPKLTTSKVYIVQGTATNINTDSNSGEIVYLETTGDGQKVIIPRASFKKKLITQPKKITIKYEKPDLLYNTFCNRFVSLLVLEQKVFILSNISRKDNDKKQSAVRHLAQLTPSIPDSEKLTYYPVAIYYWNCKKETKKVRPPPIST